MDPVITGCSPGGAIYHGCGYINKGRSNENRYMYFSESPEWISFKLVHKVHQVGVYNYRVSPGGATCHI